MSDLISGKEALIAYANGEHVQYQGYDKKWRDDIKTVCLLEFSNGSYVFRIKPKTITINGIEVPKSSSVYNGGLIWILCGTDTREYTSLALDENDELPAYFWDSEEEIKQVVSALRTIFKGEP